MSQRTSFLVLLSVVTLFAVTNSVRAQQPAGVVQPPPMRTPPPADANPSPILTPPDGAVALCKDGTWIREPGVVDDCAKFGGLGIATPPRPKPPEVVRTAPRQIRAVVVDPTPPANATGRCRDGTYLYGPIADTSCSDHDGLAVRFPGHSTPPRPRP